MARVLVLGATRDRVSTVRSLLRLDGHQVVLSRDVDAWTIAERESDVELVVAAVPGADEVLATRGGERRGFPAPLLFVHSESDFRRDVVLDDRLVDTISTPFLDQEFLARVDALIRVRRVIHRDPAARVPPEFAPEDAPAGADARPTVLRRVGRALAAALGARVPRMEKPLGPYLEVAARVADWADRRDAFQPGHAERVTGLCAMIGEGLGLGDDETASLLRAAMLHDIGKVALPVDVLHRKGPLEESQMRLIRTHPRRGAALLRALDRDDDVAKAILYHHERPDGHGYYGTPPDSVPRSARILAVAEVYDAMTSSLVRDQLQNREALARIRELAGEQLDGDCVDALSDRLSPRPRTLPLTPMI